MAFFNSMMDSINGAFGDEQEAAGESPQRDNRWQQEVQRKIETMQGAPDSGDWARNAMRNTNQAAPMPRQQTADEQDEYEEDAERDDLLDQHVAYFMKHHPEVHKKYALTRLSPGVYDVRSQGGFAEGREISVEWHYAEGPDDQGYLIAIDGPLRQPFADYMAGSETGVEYDDKRLGKSSLSQVPKANRLSFGDANKAYSRLEAMKVAKEQALVREKAAEFAKVGMLSLHQEELMSKYQKTISMKLGERRQRAPQAREQPVPVAAPPPAEFPAPPPVAAAPAKLTQPPIEGGWPIDKPLPAAEAPRAKGCPPEGTPSQSPAASPCPSPAAGKKQQTHGAPKYCANHNETLKRKKCKPQKLPCSTCQAVIQTNYVEFALCPTCSENDHRCMCCGEAAVGAAPAPSPQSSMPATSPAASLRGSPQSSPGNAQQQPPPASPMNLFGMPDLLNFDANKVQNKGYAASTNPLAAASPQNNAYASMVSGSPQSVVVGSPQNVYTSQNAFTSYQTASPPPLPFQNGVAGPPRRY